MKTQIQIKENIQQVLYSNRFAVLATECDRLPHACFVAITAMDDLFQLFFATYRNTRKYTNLTNNENVSILFENRNIDKNNQQEITVLTAFGKAKEVMATHSDAIFHTHLLRHPELNSFLLSSDCAFFQVTVEAYQLVLAVDDIHWLKNIS